MRTADEDQTVHPLSLPDEVWSKMSISWKMNKLCSTRVTGPIFKLQADILTDALAYYESPAFDPARSLRVSYSNQPAIDTGGVLRQFFTTVKEKFINGGMFKMFEGPQERLLFKTNSENRHLVFLIFKKEQENDGVGDISSLFQRHCQTNRLDCKQAVLYIYKDGKL